jgi:hypothetical protein
MLAWRTVWKSQPNPHAQCNLVGAVRVEAYETHETDVPTYQPFEAEGRLHKVFKYPLVSPHVKQNTTHNHYKDNELILLK